MKINVKRFHQIGLKVQLRWSQVWQHFAVEVATYGVAACFELMDVPNRGDASADGDKCFCDYSSCWVFGTLCGKDCTRHYSAAVSAVAPCAALKSALCSKAFHKHRTDGKRSMAEARTIGLTRFLRYHHCLIHDLRVLFLSNTPPQFEFDQRIFELNFHTVFECEFLVDEEVGETAPGNKRKIIII